VILGVIAAVLSLLGYNEILIVFGAGLISWMIYLFTSGIKGSRFNSIAPVFAANFLLQSAPGNLSLFLTFLKVGSILYVSGYVLFAFLESEFVATGILTQQQLVDAIAVGRWWTQ